MTPKLSPDRQEIAEQTGVIWNGTVIQIDITPECAANLYQIFMLYPRPWNRNMRLGIGNLIDGAPSIFDRYAPEQRSLFQQAPKVSESEVTEKIREANDREHGSNKDSW